MRDLSVLVPARNEMFLRRTVEGVLANMRGDTEVIVVLDGAWAEPRLEQHERVTIIHRPESIGQRGAVNEAARASRARYIMKLDAHCRVAEGFDVELLKAASELEPDVMQVPQQFNLHAFDWMCDGCGHTRYQGRTPEKCEKCGHEKLHREMVWKPRKSRLTTAWRFDTELHFQYWGRWKHTPEGQKEIAETMSMLGACWFVSRKRFWDIDGLDEAHGGWGQMGTELACKQWLSGSRLVCNKRTWFAHLFRSQGGDFGFPYPLKKSATDAARRYSQDLWRNGKWPKAKRPLSWLIDHFAPVPGWEGGDADERRPRDSVPVRPMPNPDATEPAPVIREGAGSSLTKGIVYYSDCRGDETILNAVRAQLARAVNGHAIVSSCLDVVPLGETRIVHARLDRGYLTMFKQILAGLELSDADVIYLCEHDVLYHPSHFDFTPPRADRYYYNENTWKVDSESGRALFYYTKQTSGLCAHRNLLLQHYRERVARVVREGFTRRMGFEPGTHRKPRGVDDIPAERWMSPIPNVDIRHRHNLTPSRWSQDQFRNHRACRGWKESDEVPGWGRTKGRFGEFLAEVRP